MAASNDELEKRIANLEALVDRLMFFYNSHTHAYRASTDPKFTTEVREVSTKVTK